MHNVFVRHLDLACVMLQMPGRLGESVHAPMCSMRKESLKKMELVLSSDRKRVKKLNFIHIYRLNLNICVVLERMLSALPSSQTNIRHHGVIAHGFRCKKELIHTLYRLELQQHAMIN